MPELWSDLADARAQAAAAEQPAAELRTALAEVEDRLGVVAGELAGLPDQVAKAQATRDNCAAALSSATSANDAAQAEAARASTAATEATRAKRARDTELTAAQGTLKTLRDLAASRGQRIEPALRQRLIQQEATVAAAERAVSQAWTTEAQAAGADIQARDRASAALTNMQQAQTGLDAAQDPLSRLLALLDQARTEQPALLGRADELRAQSASAEQTVAAAWVRFDALLEPWLEETELARLTLRDASRAAIEARLEADRAQRRQSAATRAGDDAAARAASDEAAAVDIARADGLAVQARARLDEIRMRVLRDPDAASLVGCVRTDVPLLLLPVRIETAFLDMLDGSPGLAVRVYPDTVSLDGNVAELTDDERTQGAAALAEIATGDEKRARAAWATLAAAVGAPRAAWLLYALNRPDTGSRPDGWRPPPVVRLLPDRWLVLGYEGGRRSLLACGEPIPVDLPILDSTGVPDGIDDSLRRWATDFEAAVAAGMAVHVPLTGEQLTSLDSLVVVGIGASTMPEVGSTRLAELLHAHRCTGGLALPPAGAATKVSGARANGAAAAPGSPTADLLLGLPDVVSGSDGDRAARALGFTSGDGSGPLDRVAGSGAPACELRGQASAVLWPATWGYFLDHMLTGVLTDGAREQVRRHAVGHVRGAGTLPLLQLASQPYGLWPVTSLSRFAPPADDTLGRQLAALLSGLRERVWRPAAAGVPRLDPAALAGDESGDPGGQLAATLAQRGRALGVRGRTLFGGEYAQNLSSLLAGTPVDPEAWERRRSAAAGLATLLALPQAGRVAEAAFAAQASDLALPMAGRESEVQAEIAFLVGHGWRDLRDGGAAPPATSVLALLLRHAARRSYVDAAAALLGVAAQERADPELVAVEGPQDTAWELLEQTLPDGRAAGDVLDRQRSEPTENAGLAEFDALWAGLGVLSGLDDAAWEPLVADVLDSCSHRLDAWVTSLADRALAGLRAARPTGVAVGGYGWVTDLGPTPARALRAAVASCVALRNTTAAAEIEARRGRSAANAALTAAQATLATAQATQQPLALAVADLARQLRTLEAALQGGPGRRLPPQVIQQRINAINAQLTPKQAELKAADDQVTAANDALARAQAELARASGAESIANAEWHKAEADLAQAREQLGQANAGSEEFLHAPSLQQASTAAVLRSGYLAHRADAGTADAPLSIDLSSARVRQAAHLAEGVRSGQAPAALLGYQLERDLRERGLAALILPLRTLSPYGEITKAEVTAAQLRQEADRSAAALQELRDRHTEAVEREAKAAEAQSSAEKALDEARDEESKARAAMAPVSFDPFKPPDFLAAFTRVTDAARKLAAAEIAADTARAQATNIAAMESRLQDTLDKAEAPDKAAQAAAAAAEAKIEELRGSLSDQAVEAAAANSVVDGLAVLQRYRRGRDGAGWDGSTLPLGGELPGADSPEGEQLLAAFAELSSAVDAVSDTAVAEAVHQLVQGNPARAGAAADAVAHFDAPPALEVVRTPRSGSAFTHRLAVVMDPAGASAPADGWPADASVRATAEPALERWLRRRLPHPDRVRAAVEWIGDDAVVSATGEATLAELGISALDVVYGISGDHGELTDRLLHHVDRARPEGVAPTAFPRLVRTRPEAWGADLVAWPELLAVAGALRELLAAARPCDGRDLAPPGEGTDGVDVAELTARADGAVAALQRARSLFDAVLADPGNAYDALLAAAALGVPGAVPLPAAQGDWLGQLGPAAAELARRAESLAAVDGAGPGGGGEVAHQLARLASVLGDGFRVLPLVRAQNPDELAAGAASTSELTGADPGAPWTWLARASRVRAGVARLSDALLLADAVCGHDEPPALDVLQLPHGAHPRWLALPQARPAGGELSLVLARDGVVDLAGPLAGFVVDEWSETVPDAETMTGVALRSARPRARAPQTMLLAVAPTAQHVWDLDSLEAVLLETLELARLRAVDLEALNAAGSAITQYLPAAYLATNAAGATVTTDLPAAAVTS